MRYIKVGMELKNWGMGKLKLWETIQKTIQKARCM